MRSSECLLLLRETERLFLQLTNSKLEEPGHTNSNTTSHNSDHPECSTSTANASMWCVYYGLCFRTLNGLETCAFSRDCISITDGPNKMESTMYAVHSAFSSLYPSLSAVDQFSCASYALPYFLQVPFNLALYIQMRRYRDD